MTVNDYISRMLENNEENPQIIVIYDDNHNIYYFGKAAYAPLNCWFAFKNAHMVGNELRINDIREEESNNTEREGTKMKRGIEILKEVYFCRDEKTAKLYGMEFSEKYSYMQVLIDWDKREIRTYIRSAWNNSYDIEKTVKF